MVALAMPKAVESSTHAKRYTESSTHAEKLSSCRGKVIRLYILEAFQPSFSFPPQLNLLIPTIRVRVEYPSYTPTVHDAEVNT